MNQFPATCARCGADLRTTSSIMSRFNTEMICNTCESRERLHPRYQEAHDRELAEVKAGNTIFPGIGSPPELYQPMTLAEIAGVAVRNTSTEEAQRIVLDAGGIRLGDPDTQQWRFGFADRSSLTLICTSPVRAVVQYA
jgi:hypothetical protein